MKKVIDGKIYNTETASLIGDTGFSHRGDFTYYREALYRTKKGAFFLAGEGGARSKYAKKVDQNTWSGGEGLMVLSEEEARSWAERFCESETIEQYFAVEEA